MATHAQKTINNGRRYAVGFAIVLLVLGLAVFAPRQAAATLAFVASSLLEVAPLIIPGIVVTGWLVASGASGHVAAAFRGRGLLAVVFASLIGAVTPVCGVTVLPLMVGLLAAGVPLAPIMAFWLSSPITDPAMLAATAATLGIDFAMGKTTAAFALGVLGGGATLTLARATWVKEPLRRNNLVGRLGSCNGDKSDGVSWAFWREEARRRRFFSEAASITRLILICLVPAFAAEFALNAILNPAMIAPYVGSESSWAIPLAVFVGGPAYIDGYAALPLVRALMDNGMAPGAAMAFLISGGVVSIWGAMAIAPVLKIKPFLLYLILAAAGSLLAGYGYEAIARG